MNSINDQNYENEQDYFNTWVNVQILTSLFSILAIEQYYNEHLSLEQPKALSLVGYVGHVVSAKSLENADTRHVADMSATCRPDMSPTWLLSWPFLTRHRRHHVGMPTTCRRHAHDTLKVSTKMAPTSENDVVKWTIMCLFMHLGLMGGWWRLRV